MKARELRIGNFVYGCYETEPEQEFEESEKRHVLCNFIGYDPFEKYLWVEAIEGIDYEFDNFEPVPLTEEWLLKFGAKHNADHKSFLDLKDFTFTELKTGFIAWHKGHALGIKINHVHQVQNLIFALTGEEITCASQQINKSTN